MEVQEEEKKKWDDKVQDLQNQLSLLDQNKIPNLPPIPNSIIDPSSQDQQKTFYLREKKLLTQLQTVVDMLLAAQTRT